MESPKFQHRPALTGVPINVPAFHLREVKFASYDNKFKKSLWLFGNTPQRNSVAVEVTGFRPWFYVEYKEELLPTDEKIESFRSVLNEDLKFKESFPDVVESLELVTDLVPVLGFHDNVPRKVLKLTYDNPSSLWKLKKHFETSAVQCGTKTIKLETYHTQISCENLWLFSKGLTLQSWVAVKNGIRPPSKHTTAQVELQVPSQRVVVSSVDTRELPSIPPVLVCALRMRALSHSSKTNPGKPPSLPDPRKPMDVITNLGLQLYWISDSNEPTLEFFINASISEDNVLLCEQDILKRFNDVMVLFDVDVFLTFSDNSNPINYIVQRKSDSLLSKFKHTIKTRMNPRTNQIYKVETTGRSIVDLKDALVKLMISPPLDGFDLKNGLRHPKLTRKKPNPEFYSYSYLRSSLYAQKRRDRENNQELPWLCEIEKDNATILGFIELSAASYTSVTDCCTAGQQIRVFNKLASKFHVEKLLINLRILNRPPLVVKKSNLQSSFPEPEIQDHSTEATEAKKKLKFKSLTTGKAVLAEKVSKAKKKTEKLQGGHVAKPIKGLHVDYATFTMDFASLYPSIIRGNRICYMRALFAHQKKYLTDPSYEIEYITLRAGECVCYVKSKKNEKTGKFEPVRTILPETMTEVAQQRTRAKKAMKQAKDPFTKSALNAKQLSCKVFQNAMYGFLGVERNAKLAVPTMMATVCCLGRFMIKTVRAYFESVGGKCIYGDTDSVMMAFPELQKGKFDSDTMRKLVHFAEKHSAICDTFFPKPNELEVESIKWPFLLMNKKIYCAFERENMCWAHREGGEWSDDDNEYHLLTKGIGFKKRDRCRYVREFGKQLTSLILGLKNDEIAPFMKKEMNKLVEGKVSIQDLTITCLLQSMTEYKNPDSLIQVQVARKIEKRTGVCPEAGSRLAYVVVKTGNPKDKIFMKGECADFAKNNPSTVKIDAQFYLENQLLKAIEPLLQFHDTKSLGIDRVIREAKGKLSRKRTGTKSLFDFMGKKKQKM